MSHLTVPHILSRLTLDVGQPPPRMIDVQYVDSNPKRVSDIVVTSTPPSYDSRTPAQGPVYNVSPASKVNVSEKN